MNRFFHAQEIAKPEDVIPFLAKRLRHWKRGYSAYERAHSWVNAGDIPAPVRAVLDTCAGYTGDALVEDFFDRDVDLRTPGRRSQTDLRVFVNSVHGAAVIAVEGKVDERFGDLVSTWNDGSAGKERRLTALCASLGLGIADVDRNPVISCFTERPRPSTRLSGTGQRGPSCWCIRSVQPKRRFPIFRCSPDRWEFRWRL